MIHSLKVLNNHAWARPKPGAKNSHQVSLMCYLPECALIRKLESATESELELKHSKWDANMPSSIFATDLTLIMTFM